jgi:hypothetical protein
MTTRPFTRKDTELSKESRKYTNLAQIQPEMREKGVEAALFEFKEQ